MNELKENNIEAYLFENNPNIAIGNEIIVEIFGKKYIGVVTDILQKDTSGNITKIAYNVPFLNSKDPFKFGEANFKYKIKTHD